MAYVDGFVVVVPIKNLDAYKKMSRKAGKIWKEYGALDYRECQLDDPESHGMKSFPALAGTKKDETVVFAYIVYASKAARNRINKKVMSDPRLDCGKDTMPFDPASMAVGGFKTIVSV